MSLSECFSSKLGKKFAAKPTFKNMSFAVYSAPKKYRYTRLTGWMPFLRYADRTSNLSPYCSEGGTLANRGGTFPYVVQQSITSIVPISTFQDTALMPRGINRSLRIGSVMFCGRYGVDFNLR